MLRTPIVDLLNATEPMPEVRLGGWVRTRRDAKGFTFLELNDGSCLGNIQCIVDEGTPAWDKLEGINTGACVAAHRRTRRISRKRPEMGNSGPGNDCFRTCRPGNLSAAKEAPLR